MYLTIFINRQTREGRQTKLNTEKYRGKYYLERLKAKRTEIVVPAESNTESVCVKLSAVLAL